MGEDRGQGAGTNGDQCRTLEEVTFIRGKG